jgi:hypothetical protein
MNCEQAAEFVSALFDGEQIPREAAEHIGSCLSCRSHLQEYALVGAELRRAGSISFVKTIPEGRWTTSRPNVTSWLTKWRETMRIPRFAFALMLAAILALSGGLALVRARDGRSESVVLTMKVPPNGQESRCLMRTDAKDRTCYMGVDAIPGAVIPGTIVASMRFVERDGQRAQIGIRAKFYAPGTPVPQRRRGVIDLVAELPEKTIWLEVGEPTKFSVSGLGDVELTAEFTGRDSITALVPKEPLEPAPDEFRLISPVLVEGDRVLANMVGLSAMGRVLDKDTDHAYMIYAPKFGRIILSPVPFERGVEGKIEGSYISFAKDGQSYSLLTGAPIATKERIWVLCQPGWRPSEDSFGLVADKPSIVSQKLARLLGKEKQPQAPE